MNSQEIKEEISKLEAEAKQLLANANFINGAITAFHKMLSKLENKENAIVEAIKNDSNTPNGSANSK